MAKEFETEDGILIKVVNDTDEVQHAEMRIPITSEEHQQALAAFALLNNLRKRAAEAVEVDEDNADISMLDIKGVSDGHVIVDFVQINV